MDNDDGRDPELAAQALDDLRSDLVGVRLNLKRTLSTIPVCHELGHRAFLKWEASIVAELAYRERVGHS